MLIMQSYIEKTITISFCDKLLLLVTPYVMFIDYILLLKILLVIIRVEIIIIS